MLLAKTVELRSSVRFCCMLAASSLVLVAWNCFYVGAARVDYPRSRHANTDAEVHIKHDGSIAPGDWNLANATHDGDIVTLGLVVRSRARPSLVRRTLSDADWKRCIDKGTKWKQLLESESLPSNLKPASSRVTKADLESWGWCAYGDPILDLIYKDPLVPALEALGLETDLDDAKYTKVDWSHQIDTRHHGNLYPATKAHYDMIVNPEAGVLAAADSTGPEHVRNPPPEEQMVELRKWSDVAFATWMTYCGEDKAKEAGLKYIFRLNIITDLTVDLVEMVIDGRLETLSPWPGREYDVSSKEGLALLGTPHGTGVSYLLFQHKETFGKQKTVKKVRVWDGLPEGPDNPGEFVSMLFELGDA